MSPTARWWVSIKPLAPEFCQACSERRWSVIIIHPLRYLCWSCYMPLRIRREASAA